MLAFFVADDGVHGREVWRSDGTEAGTIMVKDILPGEEGSHPALFAVIGGQVFFSADDGRHGRKMWVSDGTPPGTRRVKEINARPLPDTYWGGGGAVARGSLYFTTKRTGIIWRTDGTPAGSIRVGVEGECLASAGRIVFFAHNYTSEVWRTDGSPGGTFMLQRLRYPSALRECPAFTDVGGTTIYVGRDVRHGWEPWKSDGTIDGTAMVKDIVPGPDSSHPSMLGGVGDRAFFVANPQESLWASDGTVAGTIKLHRFHQWVGPLGGDPVVTGTFFFYTSAGGLGAELWKSDGMSEGTAMVKDINPGSPDSQPLGAAVLDGALFFAADDGVHGSELWRTDGTESGTFMVKDINPGAEVAWPDHLVSSGGVLLFGASDGQHGYELWRSDGTEAGTVMVKDINPGIVERSTALAYLCTSPSSGHCYYLR